MASPIQIVLNPQDFESGREGGGGGPSKDFFANQDQKFRRHKRLLTDQFNSVANTLEAQTETNLGYLKVVLRRSAWAKSHRPLKALLKRQLAPYVGGVDWGVVVVEIRPSSAREIAVEIERAEDQTNMRFNPHHQRDVPNPSRLRSEVGAIERVELYGPSDRRIFSLDEAIEWLSNPVTGGGYEIELFQTPPERSSLHALDENHRKLFQSFAIGLSEMGEGLFAQRLITGKREQPILAIRLDQSDLEPVLRLSPPVNNTRQAREIAPFDPSKKRHRKLLEFLDKHPLVRRVSLPGKIVRSAQPPQQTRPTEAVIPTHNAGHAHPRMGIIDGGVSDALGGWVIDRWDTLADVDMDRAHGSFIGGLTVAGRSLNGEAVCPEIDGSELVDIAVLPGDQNPDAFSSYYPDGLPQFFDEIENAVADARDRHGVRVFNMSLNIMQPAAPDHYSSHAMRLDRIADATDSLFFLSTGNIEPQDLRPEWANDNTQALVSVAAARNDGILMPAESVRNISVAAVNPPGHPSSVPFAPSRYSRRGPGLRAGVKPDLAHVGGSGTSESPVGHALFSISDDGTVVDGCGTSYATPLVAKTAAVLNHEIEGDVSRETLTALLVHNAQLPTPLQAKSLRPIARHLVGFGLPPSTQQILETEDHQITLVFATRIRKGQQLSFRFPWPESLVNTDGKCRGAARLTLVSSPPLDTRYGAEFVRVNIEGALQQELANGKWKGRLESPYLKEQRNVHRIEAELIEHGLKWSPVKVYEKIMPRGVGASSNWRLAVNYLTRAGEEMPEDGVPFTAILTLSDPAEDEPIFNDMRQTLMALGVRTADIRTAARIMPRA